MKLLKWTLHSDKPSLEPKKKNIPRVWGRHGQKGVECYHILTRNKINDVKYCIPIYILDMTTPLIISQTTDDGFIMEITGCKIKMRTQKNGKRCIKSFQDVVLQQDKPLPQICSQCLCKGKR